MKISSNKIFIFIIAILVICLFIAFIYKSNNLKEYSKNIYFMDDYINIKIYTNKEEKANKILSEVEDIYKTYDNLIDYENEYQGNLYMLNNGSTNIDYRLHKIIEYAYTWYIKSNTLNITTSNINKMKDILVNETISDNANILVDKTVILPKDVKLNLDNIAKGYINEEVATYLKKEGITKYMINTIDNIYLGDMFKNKKYNVGIVNPNLNMIYKIIKGSNIAISSGVNKDGDIKGVSVIANDSMTSTALKDILLSMSIEDGTNYIKDYDAHVIWFLSDGTIKTTEGIKNYE